MMLSAACPVVSYERGGLQSENLCRLKDGDGPSRWAIDEEEACWGLVALV